MRIKGRREKRFRWQLEIWEGDEAVHGVWSDVCGDEWYEMSMGKTAGEWALKSRLKCTGRSSCGGLQPLASYTCAQI